MRVGKQVSSANAVTLERSLFVLLLSWFIYLFVNAWGWPWEDRLFPLLILSVAVTLTLIALGRDILQSPDPDQGETESDNVETNSSEEPQRNVTKHSVIIIGWFFALVLGIYLVGFGYSIPIFTFWFLLYYLQDLKYALIVSLGTSVSVYLIFVQFLNLRLWEGIIDFPPLF